MSLEPGGRSDKYGNKYENGYLAKLLLRLVNEKLTSVTVEPLGPNSDSVEFYTTQKDNTIKYYQCKASNSTHKSWSVSDLQRYNVFQRAKRIILSAENSYYYFISPLQYDELDELCKRARTNSSPEEFVSYQLTNVPIRNLFNDCATQFGLDKNDPDELRQLVFILAHCYFEQYVSGTEAEQDLEEHIGLFFTGKAATARALLEQYANDTGNYGVKITAKDIIDYLEKQDIYIRNYGQDERVLNRITELNKIHWDTYHAIFDSLIHRQATDEIIAQIESGYSTILHGKAGCGKSGCLQELIDYLDKNHLLYLALKLDKHLPTCSADNYGKKLGLPESPIHCLATIAAGKNCVLILDQLDALRWTRYHSGEALSVCKELISQAEAINKYWGGKVSIVFASRTFDLENDKGLKSLFETKEKSTGLNWSKINVDFFAETDVLQIIGPSYNCLSSRLKKLLLTPSSLYVWSKLEDRNKTNSIYSVFELMNVWWNQIQQKCEMANIVLSDIIGCKNRIVNAMEKRSVFVLPSSLFIDFSKVIDSFVSNGLLNYNSSTKSIAFSHQSFLDYFIVSDTMNKVYNGYELKDLIGDLDEQTPTVRYRVVSVLQNLIDSDQGMFVEQSLKLLDSNAVRHYFKCTVFEVVGQCESPGTGIFKIVDTYSKKAEWIDYITQVVFYNHLPYVAHLIETYEGWFSDTVLSLLKSISYKAPDYVTEILHPFAFQNEERDSQIFWALCHDTNDDSDKMFQFRSQLLKEHPTFFQNFWGFQGLIERSSARAVYLFDILIENWKLQINVHIYLSEEERLRKYANNNYQLIVGKLFPKICEKTFGYQPEWPYYGINSEFSDWTVQDYNESITRKIVEVVKLAFEAYAQTAPKELVAFIGGITYPISAVGHELIMHGLASLSTDYSDMALNWLLSDFDKKVFVFSANQTDYLHYTKHILQRFSPCCNVTLFSSLEQIICSWKENPEKVIRTYQHRLETNRTRQYEPVYYAFWGHFQKELLPCMDYSRLSDYSRSLLGAVNRNKWIHLPHFYSGFICGPAKSVISPVDGHTEHLRDKTWLQIISTSPEKMGTHWCNRDNGPNYVEATHWSFASSLGTQAKRQPERFARLSLHFPEDCYEGYISNVLYALSDETSSQSVSVELMSKVIRRFGRNTNQNIPIAITRVIENHANKAWPYDILKLVSDIALNHPEPKENEYTVTSSLDSEHKLAHSLLDNSINCARGCALNTISSLIWEHKELGEFFKEIVISASTDEHDAVRFAVMSCVIPYYNIDRKFSFGIFQTLVSRDLRIIYAPGCWEILSREYHNHTDFIRGKIVEACLSDIEDLSECASGFLCAIAIFHNDDVAFSFLISHDFSNKQHRKICQQATYSFNMDEYHEKSEKILLHLMNTATEELPGFSRLFFDRCILIHRDKDFLIHLLESQQNIHLLHTFLDYLYESDEDICEYAPVIKVLGNGLAETCSEWNSRLVINDLVKCVVRLFDRGQDDPQIKTICLDVWDKLFMSNLQDIKPLSDMIDNFE